MKKAMRPASIRRTQLGIIVSRGMKAKIAARARKIGCSQARIAEQLMETALAYERLIAAIGNGKARVIWK
jgi:hypothetical protein